MCDKQKDKELTYKSKYSTSVIISLIIGAIYSSGFFYSFNYLSYFHLYEFKSLSIPPLYYIVNAALPISIASIVLLLYLTKEYYWPSSLEPTLKADVHESKKVALTKVIPIIVAIILFVFLGGIVGHHKAVGITQGDTIIIFNWNGNPPEGIDNKDLVPIFHHDGIYYVAERMKPAPKNPIVYAIPENQVESAVIKVINKDDISKSSSMQKYNN